MTTTSHRWARAALSFAALLALFVAIPAGLVAAARTRFGEANPLSELRPPWRWEVDEVRDALSRPLRDDAIVNVLLRASLVVIWLAVIVIAVTIVSEALHMVRHRGLPAPHVRGIGWAQGVGRWVAIGLVAVLPIGSAGSGVSADAHQPGPAETAQRFGIDDGARETTAITVPAFAPDDPGASDSRVDAPRPEVPGVHVVQRGESIYAIAADYASGDEAATIALADEILDLNLDSVMSDGQRFTNPALVRPGWTLVLPAGVGVPAPPRGQPGETSGPTSYAVVEGDTLSDIAASALDGADDWPEIWEANRGDDMGEGRTFDDPDLIVPGWELEIPDADATPDADEAHEASDADDIAESSASPSPSGPVDDATSETSGAAARVLPPVTTPPTTLTPTTSITPTTPPTSTTSTPTTTSTLTIVERGDSGGQADPDVDAPQAPSPIRLEHAALLAAGILTLVGVRRRRALRSALPHARVPPPPPEVASTARRLRTIDPGERAARIDVGVRAAAHQIAESGVQVGSVRVAKDGELTLRLTGDADLEAPWAGSGPSWTLPASVPIEMVSEHARQVGQPCLALVTVGVDPDDRDVLIELETAGLTTVEAGAALADDVVRAIGSGLATSLDSEVVHLVVASLGAECLFDHPNARRVDSVEAAIALAADLVGSTAAPERSSFDLRTRRTGGEMWEPAIALFSAHDQALDHGVDTAPGRRLAYVAAVSPTRGEHNIERGARIVAHADRWELLAFGESIEFSPIGITPDDVEEVAEILADAARPIGTESLHPLDVADIAPEPLRGVPHDIVVELMGPVNIRASDGRPGEFERSKTVELIAWLATHRERATRSAARTALWEMDVRDATFANVVSEARRALGRLVPPPGGEEWLGRTLTESLPLHDRVVTDADLMSQRVDHARLAPPAHAIDVLRPAVEMIHGLPFAGTSYLWPDADGIASSLVLLATTAAAELAGHALSVGDTDLVFWSTGRGLTVLPGHEELIGLRMRAHARAGDLAGVRQEWESYERVIMADAWSDGDPAPKLLDLRRELLTAQ